MKVDQLHALGAYPHLVTRSGGDRWPIARPLYLSNAPLDEDDVGPDDHVFTGLGTIDATGELTPAARARIVGRLSGKAASNGLDSCIVWSETDCTWIDGLGRTRQGRNPPHANAIGGRLARLLPFRHEHVRTVTLPSPLELPDGTEATHVCILHLRRDFIEISLGDRASLGDYGDVVREGHHDPIADLLDEDGGLAPIERFRGQPVTGVDDWTIMGPVQPIATGEIVREPWPEDVRAALVRLLRGEPSEALFEDVWAAVDPKTSGSSWVARERAAARRDMRAA